MFGFPANVPVKCGKANARDVNDTEWHGHTKMLKSDTYNVSKVPHFLVKTLAVSLSGHGFHRFSRAVLQAQVHQIPKSPRVPFCSISAGLSFRAQSTTARFQGVIRRQGRSQPQIWTEGSAARGTPTGRRCEKSDSDCIAPLCWSF